MMIIIRLVRLSNDTYIGLTMSDRWNLHTLMLTESLDVNQVGFSEYQPEARRLGLKIHVQPNVTKATMEWSEAETGAFSPPMVRLHVA